MDSRSLTFCGQLASTSRCARGQLTPLTMRVPTRVTRPFRHSERTEESTRVDPFSDGARSAAHSSSPALGDCKVSRNCTRSHSSSRACPPCQENTRRALEGAMYLRCSLLLLQARGINGRPHSSRHDGLELFSHLVSGGQAVAFSLGSSDASTKPVPARLPVNLSTLTCAGARCSARIT